ncbi:putative holin-like toxin [Solibacillus sp. CAU 1738]
MVTYEAVDLMFQFGMFLATVAMAICAVIALYFNQKK